MLDKDNLNQTLNAFARYVIQQSRSNLTRMKKNVGTVLVVVLTTLAFNIVMQILPGVPLTSSPTSKVTRVTGNPRTVAAKVPLTRPEKIRPANENEEPEISLLDLDVRLAVGSSLPTNRMDT